ncbi:MAG: hypothetical protein ACUVX8_03880 [Candidatus Zipacnadales bacterium]
MFTRLVLLASVLAILCTPFAGLPQEKEEKPGQPRFFFEKQEGPTDPATPPAGDDEKATTPVVEGAGQIPPAFDFEEAAQLANWQALDREAILEIADQPGVAHGGNACLQMTYLAREGVFEQLSVTRLTAVRGQTLSFWIKTDLPTNLSFGVVENTGAFYQQFAVIPPNEWTHICVPFASLILAQDSRDDTGRLEVPTITELRFADLANLPGALGDALGHKAGVQHLLLDDIALLDEPAPPVGGEGAPLLLADGFERDTIYALFIGEAQLRRTQGAVGQALEVVCTDRVQRWMGFVMAVGHLGLAEARAMSLQLTASAPIMVNITLEEWDGSKYSQRLRIGPEGGWTAKHLVLGELLLEGDSEDENERLDYDQIRVLVIVADMTRVENLPVTFTVDEVTFE